MGGGRRREVKGMKRVEGGGGEGGVQGKSSKEGVSGGKMEINSGGRKDRLEMIWSGEERERKVSLQSRR